MNMKEELNYALMECGVLSVIMDGINMKLILCASNLDTEVTFAHTNY